MDRKIIRGSPLEVGVWMIMGTGKSLAGRARDKTRKITPKTVLAGLLRENSGNFIIKEAS
jgi:hypothetical protein